MTARSDRRPGPTAWSPLDGTLNLVSLGLLTWGVTEEARLGLGGARLAALVLLVSAVISWLTWIVVRSTGPASAGAAALAAMALTGGALVVFAPVAIVFPAIAALRAATGWRLQSALFITSGGWIAMPVAAAASGHSFGVVFGGLAASYAGMVMGISRRQAVERAEQAALVSVETERAEIERARAELLADRNHLARELHDVLAHTLSALSLQLEAVDAVVESDPNVSAEVRRQLDRTRKLVHEGLAEARSAVRALRENAAPLVDQLAQLCDEHKVHLSMRGTPQQLSPQISLSLYRIAQETLTNAMKHAPGAMVSVCLSFASQGVSLEVENGPAMSSSAALGASGGGFGLQGIAERLALVGGKLQAGPTAEGWRVLAEVPVSV